MPWDLDDLEADTDFAEVAPEESARLHALAPPSPSGEVGAAGVEDQDEFTDCWDPDPPLDGPVIFLDVDGVLHAIDADRKDFLGEEQLEQLRRIVDATGARLVLSSTWRHHEVQAQEVAAALIASGMRPPVGGTPDMWRAGRGAEIREWLAREDIDIEDGQWVAIDDLELTPELPAEHVVLTDPGVGLTSELADEAIAKLMAVSVP